jgi:hypothetical protein
MNDQHAIAILLLVSVVGCTSPPSEDAAVGQAPVLSGTRPNVLLILLVDLGFDDLGLHGNEIVETPHIDALARGSVRFERFYVTPVCATTRAALLTGRHHLRTGLDVLTAGTYEGTAEFMGNAPTDVGFTVGTPVGHGRLRIDPGGAQTPARLTLPTGPVVLTAELDHAGDADRVARARMSAIVLRRR